MDFFSIKYVYKLLVFIRYHWKFLLVLISLVFMLFAFTSSAFAYSESDNWSLVPRPYTSTAYSSTNMNLISVSFTSNSLLEGIRQTVFDYPLYASGDYYYFIGYTLASGQHKPYAMLIPKSVFSDVVMNLKFNLAYGPSDNGYLYGAVTLGSSLYNKISNYYSTNKFQGVYWDGKWDSYIGYTLFGQTPSGFWSTGLAYGIVFSASDYNSSTYTSVFPFLSDIPYQITRTTTTGTSVIFNGASQPYLANTLYELQTLSTTINVVPSISTDLTLKLIDLTTNTDLFQVTMDDFGDYLARVDLDDPFSDLAYKIPIDKLPSFSYEYGHNYDFLLTYKIFATGPYNLHFYVTSQYEGNNPVGGGVSPGGGSGGGEEPRWYHW